MNAVMACIAEEGLERTTMRNVAQRAGVSTGTLAYYFSDKKELVDATLLDASEKYMERFHSEQRPSGPAALDHLFDRFLASDNTDAAFVLQMIEVGLHNAELRASHQDMVEAGREQIERCLRVGIETGVYRNDIDPGLAAALLHGVLIWWGSELTWNASPEDLARGASRLALTLMEREPGRPKSVNGASPISTLAAIRSLLLSDPKLDIKTAETLSSAIGLLYGMATEKRP
jgi:AcrR family transcriptional regulator